MEPIAIGALQLGKKFILVGDDLQLPPVVVSENTLLSTSLFEKLRLK